MVSATRVLREAFLVGGVPALVLLVLCLAGALSPLHTAVAMAVCGLAAAGIGWLWVHTLAGLAEALRRTEQGGFFLAETTPLLPEAAEVADGVRRMARNLEERNAQVSQLREADGAIVEGLPDPLLVLAADRQPLRANAAARALFGADTAALLRHPALAEAVDRAMAEHKPQLADLVLPVPVLRELQAQVIPMPPLPGGGAVLVVLSDRTRERQVERMRADFVANASHELRTPLSIVRASAEMAQLDIDATHPAAPWIADIINENRHMTTIIENLLTIARTQQRLATVPRYDLAPLIQKTIITTQQHAPLRHITSNCSDTAFFCTSDPNYVTHILRILLDNALVHTADTCHINVQLRLDAGHCEILVCDDGHGIPADQVSQIFEPFVSIDRGTSHRGSGIGLSIAQSFCNAINATIRYQPNQPHGACFVVRLAEL